MAFIYWMQGCTLKNAHAQLNGGMLCRIGMYKYPAGVCGLAEVVPALDPRIYSNIIDSLEHRPSDYSSWHSLSSTSG